MPERRMKKELPNIISKGNIDMPFLILVIVLLSVGLVMMFSASYPSAYEETGDAAYYFKRQLIFAVMGIGLMFVASKIKSDYYRLFGLIGMAVSVLLLLLVFVTPQVKPGFYRWIMLPGGQTFQPSDIAKMCLVLFLAWGMEKDYKTIIGRDPSRNIRRDKHGKPVSGFLLSLKPTVIYGGAIVATALLVYLENHLSGALLLMGIGVIMLFVGEFKSGWFIFGLSVAAVAVVFFVLKPEILKDYAGERIVAWLDKTYEPLGARWQTNQALYAIGSGGFLGVGLGNSTQKHHYVSEPQNDMIFSIVCEELGFVGSALIIILFALLVWRGVVIATHAKDRFGAYATIGMVFQVGLQSVLNIAVATDSIPNTGIALPFFSSGGTALVMLLVEMGIVLSVSRDANLDKAMMMPKGRRKK